MFKRFLALLAATCVALGAVAAPAAADDHRRWRGHDRYERHYDRGHDGYYNRHRDWRHDDDDDDDEIVAGVVGLALGAVIGAAVAQNRQDRYERDYYGHSAPPPRYGYNDGYRSDYRQERTCYRRERQWDPYANRYLWVDVPYAC